MIGERGRGAEGHRASLPPPSQLLEEMSRPCGVPPACHRIPKVEFATPGAEGFVSSAPLCKRFMKGVDHDAASCNFAHLPFAERPPCPSFSRGYCPRGDRCWYPHLEHRKPLDTIMAVRCEAVYSRRVAFRISELVPGQQGLSCVVGFARSGPKPKADVVLFLFSPLQFGPVLNLLMRDEDLRNVVSSVYKLDRRCEKLEAIVEIAKEHICLGAAGEGGVRIQCFPPPVSRSLCAQLDLNVSTSKTYSAVVDVLYAHGYWYLGLRTKADCKSDDALAGELRMCGMNSLPLLPTGGSYWPRSDLHSRKRQSKAVCKAFFKLDEAIRSAGINVRPGWHCLDIGASPGGWTQKLSDCLCRGGEESLSTDARVEGKVYAVDPGALEIDPLPAHVVHLRELAAASGDFLDGLSRKLDGNRLSLVACDANVHPEMAAQIVVALKPLQSDKCWVVLSMKNFCGSKSRWEREIQPAIALLDSEGYMCQLLHLFANAPAEKTIVGRLTLGG